MPAFSAFKGVAGKGAPVGNPPVVDSVTDLLFGTGTGIKSAVTLSGGAIVEADTEYIVTHFSDVGTGSSHPTYPGGSWTAYTGDGADEGIKWDAFGSENGPLSQPTSTSPYIGDDPWNQHGSPQMDELPQCAGRWKRLSVKVSNADGDDTAFVFFKPESC